ncbi:hypothetical protein Sps_03872 [Shewanella psychrophila]|uniref:Uncharacterized protein n=1 Tax=Shewanella psychrophila TaxID=225848 RepID=A0A1S6HTU4_9GAMM|nr:hypothetical protein [Shewanella psychrophila]AQS38987.1 hypothetical protein Sps_03872 [Shewanella psychrophila]
MKDVELGNKWPRAEQDLAQRAINGPAMQMRIWLKYGKKQQMFQKCKKLNERLTPKNGTKYVYQGGLV